MKQIFPAKKADVFMIAFIIVTFLALALLAYTIHENNVERQKELPVGAQAVALFNLYNEIQSSGFYLQESAIFSQNEAYALLASNGGYPAGNNCKKTEKKIGEESLVIFGSSCGDFNPEESYKAQFKKTFLNYALNYKSPPIFENLNPSFIDNAYTYISACLPDNKPTDIVAIPNTYTNMIVSSQIQEHKITADKELVTLTSKKYPIAFSTNNSYLTHQSVLALPPQNLQDFNKLYSALAACKAKPAESCELIIKQEFPAAVLTKSANLLKINTNTAIPIKLAFNSASTLPRTTVGAFTNV